MYKMYCIMSKDALKKMNGIRGKATSQAGHAFLHAFWNAEERFPQDASLYKYSMTAKKITLVAQDETVLQELLDEYSPVVGTSLVKDAGLTVFKEPTVTCLGIGPIHEDYIGESLKKLPLLR